MHKGEGHRSGGSPPNMISRSGSATHDSIALLDKPAVAPGVTHLTFHRAVYFVSLHTPDKTTALVLDLTWPVSGLG